MNHSIISHSSHSLLLSLLHESLKIAASSPPDSCKLGNAHSIRVIHGKGKHRIEPCRLNLQVLRFDVRVVVLLHGARILSSVRKVRRFSGRSLMAWSNQGMTGSRSPATSHPTKVRYFQWAVIRRMDTWRMHGVPTRGTAQTGT